MKRFATRLAVPRLLGRIILIAAIGAALWSAACGGGNGSFNQPPPNQGPFSLSSLKGQYAFTTNGEVFTGNSVVTSQLTRVGSFTADGAGNITGGIEDANALGAGVTTSTITNGTYTLNSDGHGTLTLNVNGSPLQFSIVLTSVNDGLMVDLTVNNNQASTGSGNFVKQNQAAFSQTGFSGAYAFDFTGQYPDNSGNPTSIVGQLTSNGGGGLTVTEDIDEAGGISGEVTNIPGVYSDASPTATLASFGRGVAQVNDSSAITGGVNPTFVFYIVDNTRVRFLGTSGNGILSGDAVLQQSVPTNVSALNSGFVFALGGTDLNAGQPLSRIGRVTINGSSLASLLVDTNDAGTVTKTNAITAGSSSISLDSTGTGRGVLTLKDPNQGVPYKFVFYLTSATSGVIQDISGTGIVADGSLTAQTGGPFSGSNVTGSYAFNWSGASIAGNSVDEEDIIGQGSVTSAALKGVADINEFPSGQQLGATATGTFTFNGDGTGGSGSDNQLKFTLTTSSSTNINFVPYVVSPTLIFFTSGDSNRVVLGTLNMQH